VTTEKGKQPGAKKAFQGEGGKRGRGKKGPLSGRTEGKNGRVAERSKGNGPLLFSGGKEERGGRKTSLHLYVREKRRHHARGEREGYSIGKGKGRGDTLLLTHVGGGKMSIKVTKRKLASS